MQNHLKHELHNVLSGKSQVRFGAIIQSIASYLNDGTQASAIIEDEKHFKKQETKRLENYISDKNLWIDIDLTQYVSEGAEQKVYLKDTENVLKLAYDNVWVKRKCSPGLSAALPSTIIMYTSTPGAIILNIEHKPSFSLTVL